MGKRKAEACGGRKFFLGVEQEAGGVFDAVLHAQEEGDRLFAVHEPVVGKEAVTFLIRVKDCIENPARLLLDA